MMTYLRALEASGYLKQIREFAHGALRPVLLEQSGTRTISEDRAHGTITYVAMGNVAGTRACAAVHVNANLDLH
jgi:hypothetical protein